MAKMKLFFRVGATSPLKRALFPSDDASQAALQKMSFGDIVSTTIRRPRNPKHHAKLFAMLQIVWESTAVQDRYPRVENLLDALKLAMGYCEPVSLPDGTAAMKVKSIAFESMDQAAFEEFYDGAVEIIVTRLVPHLNRKDLEARVMEMIG